MSIDARRIGPVVALALVCAMLIATGCGKLRKPDDVLPAAKPDEQPGAPPEAAAREPAASTPEESIAAFQALPHQQKNDAELIAIARHTEQIGEIDELVLAGSAVTDQGAAELPKFTGLKTLHLSGSRVSGKSLEYAAELPSLDALGVNGISMEDGDLQALQANPSITELSLAGTSIGDGVFETLATLEHLQVLDVSGNDQVLGRTFTELVKQRQFGELRIIRADGSGFGYYGLLELGALRNLEHLSVVNSFVSDEALTGLRTSKSLKTLHLHNNKITSAGLQHLRRLTQLEELTLGGNRAIGDDGLKSLRSLKQLRILSLGGTTCTEAAVRELKERHLKSTLVRFGGKEL